MSSEPFSQSGNLPAPNWGRQNSPGDTEVRGALAKILASDPFVRSDRIKRLLQFLVEGVMRENQGALKETLIGIEAFDREPGYDTKQDPVVRVEMRRLRSKLSEYYLNEGKNDTVLIWLEKGSYIPALSWRTREMSPSVSSDTPASSPIQPKSILPVGDLNRPGFEVVTPAKKPARKRIRTNYLLGTVVFALVLGIVLVLVFRPRKSNAPSRFRVFPLAGNAGLETSPVFSPDSKQVAYAWDGNRRNFDIYVKSLETSTLSRLTDNAAHEIDPTWSPQGDRIAFLRVSPSKTQLVIIPSTSGVEKVVAEVDPGIAPWQPEEPVNNGDVGPVWSRDGSYLIVTASKEKSSGLRKITLDGRQQMITEAPMGTQDNAPRISPSGAAIAFRRVWGAASSDLFVISGHGRNPVRLTFDSHDIEGLDWLDEQNLIYSSNRGGNYRLWQISSTGGAARLFLAGGSQPQWPSVSRDGHWLAFVEPSIHASIWRLRFSAGSPEAEPFISSAGQDYSATYSPDGKKIAYVSDRSGTAQIWISDTDGAGGTQITNFKGSSVGSPQWSPDSRRIVFDGIINGLSSIWVIDADGSDLRQLNNNRVRQYLPTWSRDGRWIYFTSLDKGGRDHLWKQNPESGESAELTSQSFYDARESPDLKTLYFEHVRGGIWQMPVDGGTPIPIPELSGMIPARYWTLSDNIIYFVRQGEHTHTLESFDLVTRRFRKLAVLPAQLMAGTRGLSVSPRRDTILFIQKDQRRSSVMLQER